MTDLEDSSLVPVNTFESVDELILFDVMPPTSSEGDSVKEKITNELNKELDKIIDEGFESIYQLGNEIIKDGKVNMNELNYKSVVEVACTKQTAQKYPSSGMPLATRGEGGTDPGTSAGERYDHQ